MKTTVGWLASNGLPPCRHRYGALFTSKTRNWFDAVCENGFRRLSSAACERALQVVDQVVWRPPGLWDRRIVPWPMPAAPGSLGAVSAVVAGGSPASGSRPRWPGGEQLQRLNEGFALGAAALDVEAEHRAAPARQLCARAWLGWMEQRMAHALHRTGGWPKLHHFRCCACAVPCAGQVSMPADQPGGVRAHAGAKVAQPSRRLARSRKAPTVLSS